MPQRLQPTEASVEKAVCIQTLGMVGLSAPLVKSSVTSLSWTARFMTCGPMRMSFGARV